MVVKDLGVVPYPQEMEILSGKLLIASNPILVAPTVADAKERLALASIRAALEHPRTKDEGGAKIGIRVGSVSTMKDIGQWLTKQEALRLEDVSDQGYLLKVDRDAVTIVGKTPIGTLYGAQTLIQIFRHYHGRKGYAITAVSALLVTVGVFYVLIKLGRLVDAMKDKM